MTEADEQREFVAWFRETWPEHARALRVSQSGGFRGHGGRGAIMMSQAKGQGAVRGEADIVILLPRKTYGALVIEHKAAGGAHKLSDDQDAYLYYHNYIGNLAVSTRGIEALKAAVMAYMES